MVRLCLASLTMLMVKTGCPPPTALFSPPLPVLNVRKILLTVKVCLSTLTIMGAERCKSDSLLPDLVP